MHSKFNSELYMNITIFKICEKKNLGNQWLSGNESWANIINRNRNLLHKIYNKIVRNH